MPTLAASLSSKMCLCRGSLACVYHVCFILFTSYVSHARHLGKQFLSTGGDEADDGGVLQSAASQLHSKHGVAVDEQRQTVVLQRYCHVFTQGEIEELWTSLQPSMRCSIGVADVSVEETFFDAGNWCVRVRKSKDA